jgi:uncharacterized MAPEG superfamily protein
MDGKQIGYFIKKFLIISFIIILVITIKLDGLHAGILTQILALIIILFGIIYFIFYEKENYD